MNLVLAFSLQDWTSGILVDIGLEGKFLAFSTILINIVALFLVVWAYYLVLLKALNLIVKPWTKKFENKHINIFFEKRTLQAIALLGSGFLIYFLLPTFFNLTDKVVKNLRILTVLYIIVMIMVVFTRIIHSLEYLGYRSKRFEKKPISSYTQISLIVIYLLSGILIISILIGKRPMTIITAFSAGMAIVLLVFKDLILGLVASVQVSVNDMVRIGDWIRMPDFNADGEVTEINLTSVKIRNWDYTVANVPTFALVSSGFDNVREMEDKGIRRMMHHVLIDIRSIKEVDKDFIDRLKEVNLFDGESGDLNWTDHKDYDFEKVTKITNLGLFRRFIENYLMEHPGINNDYMVVRQLQHQGNGLPLEIYAFVESVSFKPLNLIQSDIFEYLYTVMKDFELELYQRPLGDDFKDSFLDKSGK